MKLLFDQNLSRKLCPQLDDVFPDSQHVLQLGLDAANDLTIWQHARDNGIALATQDADYVILATLHGAPPKILWLRCGNQPTRAIEQLIRTHIENIHRFERSQTGIVLEIY